jgi:hypothetical protein
MTLKIIILTTNNNVILISFIIYIIIDDDIVCNIDRFLSNITCVPVFWAEDVSFSFSISAHSDVLELCSEISWKDIIHIHQIDCRPKK